MVQPKFIATGGQEIEIGLTRKPVSPWGGLALFAAFGEAIGLRRAVERALAGLSRTSPNALPSVDLYMGFMVGVLTGASRFLHLERLRADAVLKQMFGLSRFVAPTTYARFFQSFTGQAREDAWASLVSWTLRLLPPRPEGYVLDVDSTVVERCGEQEGALQGYNPRKRGGVTHHPVLAGLAEHRVLLHAWLRSGNSTSGDNVVAFLSECLGLARNHVKLAFLRADNGFFDKRILDFLEDEQLLYLVKAPFTKYVALAARQAGDWVDLGDGLAVAEARIKLVRWTRERRLVLIRHSVAEREKPQGKLLPEVEGFQFQAIVTSFPPEVMDAATVYRSYLPRGEFENRIKELKQGCGLNGFCLEDFSATETVLRSLCLVHNLVQVFQDRIGLRPADRPKKEGPRYTLETLRNTLFTCAAVLGRRGRQVVLRLSTTEAWIARFQQALARLLPVASNCRAGSEGQVQPALNFDG
jgi:hypothetical protein